MFNVSLIVPLPPGSTAFAATGETKEAVGLYPCLNQHCEEWALVKVDNKGCLYVQCSRKEITISGCGSQAKTDGHGRPDQNADTYQQQLETVTQAFPMKDSYRRYLENAWEQYEGGSDAECSD